MASKGIKLHHDRQKPGKTEVDVGDVSQSAAPWSVTSLQRMWSVALAIDYDPWDLGVGRVEIKEVI